MIKTQTCCTVMCDGCQTEFSHDYTPHWPEAQEARWETEESEWVSDGTVDYCPACTDKPHPFRLKPNTTDECWRCSAPADEHLADSGEAGRG